MQAIAACNGAFATMFGTGPDDVVGQPPAQFLAALNGAAFDERVEDEVAGRGDRLPIWR